MKTRERILGYAALFCAMALLCCLVTWKNYQSGRLLVEKSEGHWLLLMREVPSTPSLADLLTRQGNYVYACEVKSGGVSLTACTFNLGGSYRIRNGADATVIKGQDGEEEFRFVFGDGRAVKCHYSAQTGAEWRFE